MNDPNSANPPPPRATLKLKVGARKPPEQIKPEQIKTEPAPRPSKVNQKPGAQWSDEYKQRMQADMDALVR